MGPLVGSCGAAAYHGLPVFAPDIATDPRWHGYSELPLAAGFRGCWSSPVKNAAGRVVAAFGLYFRTGFSPGSTEQRLVDACVDICALAAERQAARTALEATTRNLGVALGSMSQGLCLADANDCLLLKNDRFCATYGFDPELLPPGIHLRDVLAYSHRIGNYPGRTPEDVWASRKAFIDRREPGIFLQELGDGRRIAIAHQPLEDGGWVATYEDVTERRQRMERMTHLAQHDSLTGLPNRALLLERLESELASPGPTPSFALLYIDLDRFKVVNDLYGHRAGDALLRVVSQALRRCAGDHDLVARLGGDEFCILALSAPTPDQASDLAARIVATVAIPHALDGFEVRTGASIGIAMRGDGNEAATAILGRADLALYQAKAEGRSTARHYQRDMGRRQRSRQLLATDLRDGSPDAGNFDLAYRPVASSIDNAVIGFEAELSWRHPEFGALAPDEVGPIVAEAGPSLALAGWATLTACADASRWPGTPWVALHWPGTWSRNRAIVVTVQEALRNAALPPARLGLVVDAAAFLAGPPEAAGTLAQLQQLGVRIILDDSADGLSWLACLRQLKFDAIKVSARLLDEAASHPGTNQAVQALASLQQAGTVHIQVAGTEDSRQAAQVRTFGLATMSGRVVGPAISLDRDRGRPQHGRHASSSDR